jgi:hypothetical protein
MVVKMKRGQCLVSNLIHTLKFNTFIFFIALLCCSDTFEVQIVNVDLNLVNP